MYRWFIDSLDFLHDASTLRNAFNAVTRPLLTSVHLLYDRQIPHRLSCGSDVEITSILERLLAYAVSGSSKIFSGKAINAYGLRASYNTGMPQIQFNNAVLPCPTPGRISDTFSLNIHLLPSLTANIPVPLLNATASIRWHAGVELATYFAESVTAGFEISHRSVTMTEKALTKFVNEQIQSCMHQFSNEFRNHIIEKQKISLAHLVGNSISATYEELTDGIRPSMEDDR